MLRIFQSEINAQISVIKAQRASTFIAQQQGSEVGKQVTYWRNQVASLQQVIDSGGAAALNPQADPELQSLTNQRNAQTALEQQYYRQWQCQLYGGSACPAGNGPLAQASENSYHQAQAEVTQLTNEILQRENELAATDKLSEKSRYDQAAAALPPAQQQLNVAVAREDELQANFDAQNLATNGILVRLQALSQLSTDNFTVASARFLVFLLFLVIECLPVTVKLLQQPGTYEKILQTARESELGNARRFFRVRPRTGTAEFPGDALWPEPDVDLSEIWQTKVPPQPAADGEETTEKVRRDLRHLAETMPDGAVSIPRSSPRLSNRHCAAWRTSAYPLALTDTVGGYRCAGTTMTAEVKVLNDHCRIVFWSGSRGLIS